MTGQARAIAVVAGSVAFLCGAGIATLSGAPCDVAAMRGLVIGGVAAMDPETGVISPGGIGYELKFRRVSLPADGN